MNDHPSVASIDEYIAQFPPATQKALEELRAIVHSAAPGATERISYAIPCFDLDGRYLIYMAGWKQHIGVYPITGLLAEAFAADVAPYLHGKATARFPLGQPIPADLVRRLVAFRVDEVREAKTEAKAPRRRKAAALQ